MALEDFGPPTMDLRMSEFAPDRDAATVAWAAEQLRQEREQTTAQRQAQREMWDELARESEERLTALRLAAIARGEVYVPPPPVGIPGASAVYYPSGAMSMGATVPHYRH